MYAITKEYSTCVHCSENFLSKKSISNNVLYYCIIVFVQADDIISVTHRINDEWIYGMIGSSEGMFPAGFVDNVPDNLPLKKDDKTENVTDTTETIETTDSEQVPKEIEKTFVI